MAATPTSNAGASQRSVTNPGVFGSAVSIGLVELTGPAAEEAVRLSNRVAPDGAISWNDLVLLKLLAPAEAADVVISVHGREIIHTVATTLMANARMRRR